MPDNTTDTALVRVIPGRPAVIEHNGCRIYLTVHDQYYLTMLREWKGKLRLSHPDMIRHIRKPVTIQARVNPPSSIPEHSVKGYTQRNGVTGKIQRCGESIHPAYERGAVVIAQHTRMVPVEGAKGSVFRRNVRKFEEWKKREEMWYAQWGLTPPSWGD